MNVSFVVDSMYICFFFFLNYFIEENSECSKRTHYKLRSQIILLSTIEGWISGEGSEDLAVHGFDGGQTTLSGVLEIEIVKVCYIYI